mgnify:CR=1 FL=1
MKKIIITTLILLVTLIGLYIWAQEAAEDQQTSTNVTSTKFFRSQDECEQVSGESCRGPIMCDYVPNGRSLEEACGKGYFKGAWTVQK